MNRSAADCDERSTFELHFRSLFDARPSYVFPCDSDGRVDINVLGERARDCYLYARAVVGRELSAPTVQPCTLS